MSNPFERIYKYNLWLSGSGTGSLSWNNKPYLSFLERIITKYNIQSILEIGCGDCRLWNSIRFGGKYIGIDIVDCKIDPSHKYYGCYRKMDILEETTAHDIYGMDLILIKDLFVHLPGEKITTLIQKVQELRPKYLLFVEDEHYLLKSGLVNFNISEGMYRPIDLEKVIPNRLEPIENLAYYEITYLLWINLWITLAFVLFLKRQYLYVGLIAIVILLWVPRKRALLYKN